MNQHEHTEKGAPLFFFYMIELISPNLDTTVRAVVKCLDNMKITDYDAENVSTVVTYLRTVSEYLTQNDAVPNDFDTMVFDVMKTATTVEFQDKIKMKAIREALILFSTNYKPCTTISLLPRNGLCLITKPMKALHSQSITLRVRVGTVARRDMLSHNAQIQRTKV